MRRLILLSLASILAACASQDDRPEPQAQGESLRVATEASFPPFNELDAGGEPAGLDIELFRRAASRAGYRVEFVVESEFAELFRMIDDGRADAIASTVGITAERRRRYLFTRPYFETGIAVIVRAGEQRIREPEEIASRTVGAAAGTSSIAIAQEFSADEVREFTTSSEAVEALIAGSIDAYLIDEVEARRRVEDRPGEIRLLEHRAASESYAFLFAKSHRQARDRIDAALRELGERGVIDSLLDEHNLRP